MQSPKYKDENDDDVDGMHVRHDPLNASFHGYSLCATILMQWTGCKKDVIAIRFYSFFCLTIQPDTCLVS